MNNKVILKKATEEIEKIRLTNAQRVFMDDLFKRIGSLEERIETNGVNINPTVFLNGLLENEAISSERIEGTNTKFGEQFYDILGIDNVYAWTTRNLINAYKDTYRRIDTQAFSYNTERLIVIHENLFAKTTSDFLLTFDPSIVIDKVKPGVILTDDSLPNWIGPKGSTAENASLVLIKPSQKKEYLSNLFELVNDKKELTFEKIILFHPLFEAIHPFADGNGRVGRLLLSSLVLHKGISKYPWIHFSEHWSKNKDEYIAKMKEVQVTGKWNNWVFYFIGSLFDIVKKREKQIDKIIDLKNRIVNNTKLNNAKLYVLNMYFKHIALKRSVTINKLKEQKITHAMAYRAFEDISNLIDAESNNDLFIFRELEQIITK